MKINTQKMIEGSYIHICLKLKLKSIIFYLLSLAGIQCNCDKADISIECVPRFHVELKMLANVYDGCFAPSGMHVASTLSTNFPVESSFSF